MIAAAPGAVFIVTVPAGADAITTPWIEFQTLVPVTVATPSKVSVSDCAASSASVP